MRNHSLELGIFRKEWRAKRRLLILMGSVLMLLGAYMLGRPEPNGIPIALFAGLAAAILGITLLPRDEADPARSFVYQLPVSRRRMIGMKLLALASQIGAMLLVVAAILSIMLLKADTQHTYIGYNQVSDYEKTLLALFLAACSAPALALLGAIVSLHMRSPIVALLVTLALGWVLGLVILAPHALGQFTMIDQSGRATLRLLQEGGAIAIKFAVAAALLAGWLFFVWCRTRIMELSPTPRVALVFLFGVGAVEVFYTAFYTGWRDLVWMVLGW